MHRTATEDDVPSLAHIHATAVATAYQHIFPANLPKPTPESLEQGWQELVTTETVIVAEPGSQIVGMVALAADGSVPSRLLLKRLHVLPGSWGQGIGAQLHDKVIDLARQRGADKLNLWVLEDNARARGMYERRGWTLAEPRRTFANQPTHIVDVLYTRRL